MVARRTWHVRLMTASEGASPPRTLQYDGRPLAVHFTRPA
jgi:hypothetical protein